VSFRHYEKIPLLCRPVKSGKLFGLFPKDGRLRHTTFDEKLQDEGCQTVELGATGDCRPAAPVTLSALGCLLFPSAPERAHCLS